jgi:ethanolamine ammonia-lyase large subunit
MDIDFKRLYELSIIEKEKITLENLKNIEIINQLKDELNKLKNNFYHKNYYKQNKEKIIERVKEYDKTHKKDPEKIKEYNRKAYQKRKINNI